MAVGYLTDGLFWGRSLCFIPLCVKTVGYGIRPYVKMSVYVHIPPPFKRCRHKMLIASLCAFYAEDRFFRKIEVAQFTFWFYETNFS